MVRRLERVEQNSNAESNGRNGNHGRYPRADELSAEDALDVLASRYGMSPAVLAEALREKQKDELRVLMRQVVEEELAAAEAAERDEHDDEEVDDLEGAADASNAGRRPKPTRPKPGSRATKQAEQPPQIEPPVARSLAARWFGD
jgi:hypothetical protein